MKYDFLIVGAGLYGAVFAHEAAQHGKKCLVIDRRTHIAGNLYCEEVNGIQVHRYGAHIFHTKDPEVWDYVNRFARFNHFINAPIAVYHDELYNLPFNMNTFSKLWGVRTPAQAQEIIVRQVQVLHIGTPRNLEEQALSMVGTDVYEKLIKGYTEKQWGRPCRELPAFIIQRLPLRFTYNNNYFDDPWQGVPVEGYTALVAALLKDADVQLNTDYFTFCEAQPDCAEKTLFTGMIDAFYGYRFGHLAYRSLRFEMEELPMENYQGNAVVNYTAREVPYTRIIEHKHFAFGTQPTTVITREYPQAWEPGLEPYYPVNDAENSAVYQKYAALAQQEPHTLFGGRLGSYAYYNMDQTVAAALRAAQAEFGG